MIDDLTSMDHREPYRLMTSRAEYRLLLRSDNADLRLTPIGYALGLISEERYRNLLRKQEIIADALQRLREGVVTNAVGTRLLPRGTTHPNRAAYHHARRRAPPGNTLHCARARCCPTWTWRPVVDEAAQQADFAAKYSGYIVKQEAEELARAAWKSAPSPRTSLSRTDIAQDRGAAEAGAFPPG